MSSTLRTLSLSTTETCASSSNREHVRYNSRRTSILIQLRNTKFQSKTCYVSGTFGRNKYSPTKKLRVLAYNERDDIIESLSSISRSIPAPQLDGEVKVLGLGQAMVDFAALVNPEFLQTLSETTIPSLDIGGRCCIGADERGEVLTALDGNDYKLSAGGSLSNTLVALSRLAANSDMSLPGHNFADVSIACSLGPDYLGDFYRTKLKKAGVQVLSDPGEDGTTGSVIVLTTPDAHRTMLSCWGTSATLNYDSALDQAIAETDVLIIEGYLWEMPETIASIKRAIQTAKAFGVKIAFTASDASCVSKHKDEFWELLENGDIDVFFANRAEALEMMGTCIEEHLDDMENAVKALAKRAHMVAVTDGSRGATLMKDGQMIQVPPHWTETPPVDTCGAGDAYAAGCLYGMLTNQDVHTVGKMGAHVASVVIGHSGARLSTEDARSLMNEPLFQMNDSIPLGFKADMEAMIESNRHL
mmetsp:Transcript_22828/g.31806  ORF Transcript_22828/g.31806 Transcript_22828/m.31806 type:complete len:473 (-) Transcript_22828:192-1610(-)|eukprot:CAMPEP_0196580280 /NCGR_PEP_ID=MMETSP1081-20130531/28248_1 /TAXON_ID=36882 /ORGANISM="Pyramimonas amylifera, Strain CCMP720" /LENGTH=472 /DNA_ID=CAMNT_0041900113 /DNA_START=151 /DNA_END=1569 /DNA_ORIENTATION=-